MINNSGWRISDASVRSGLEQTFLVGRSHFLPAKEAGILGLPGATILLDGGAFSFLFTNVKFGLLGPEHCACAVMLST